VIIAPKVSNTNRAGGVGRSSRPPGPPIDVSIRLSDIFFGKKEACMPGKRGMAERARRKGRKQRARITKYLQDYRIQPCAICGFVGEHWMMDIHHLDPQNKERGLWRCKSWASVDRELSGCIVLCRQCHKEAHSGLHPNFLFFKKEPDPQPTLFDMGVSPP